MQRQQNQLQLINDLKSKCQIGKYKGNHCHAWCKLSKWNKNRKNPWYRVHFFVYWVRHTAFRDSKCDLSQNMGLLEVIVSILFFVFLMSITAALRDVIFYLYFQMPSRKYWLIRDLSSKVTRGQSFHFS